MADALDEQIEAYEALQPTIKQKHGAVWVLMADRRVIKTFAEFAPAARYARKHFGKKQVLIRHTAERRVESAPYAQVHLED